MSQLRADAMNPEKNLHAAVPPALLVLVQEVAQEEHISVDEFVQEAMERRLRERRRYKLRTYGEERFRATLQAEGLDPNRMSEDEKMDYVDRAVHESRAQERERQNKDHRR